MTSSCKPLFDRCIPYRYARIFCVLLRLTGRAVINKGTDRNKWQITSHSVWLEGDHVWVTIVLTTIQRDHDDVIKWRLKLPAWRWFTQSFIEAQIKEKTAKLRVTGLCEGNSLVTGEFHAQRTSNAENVSIWWHHHGQSRPFCKLTTATHRCSISDYVTVYIRFYLMLIVISLNGDPVVVISVFNMDAHQWPKNLYWAECYYFVSFASNVYCLF